MRKRGQRRGLGRSSRERSESTLNRVHRGREGVTRVPRRWAERDFGKVRGRRKAGIGPVLGREQAAESGEGRADRREGVGEREGVDRNYPQRGGERLKIPSGRPS